MFDGFRQYLQHRYLNIFFDRKKQALRRSAVHGPCLQRCLVVRNLFDDTLREGKSNVF